MKATIVNAGVGGSHTGRLSDNARHRRQHALDRLDRAVRKQQPNVVIVQFGINDSWVDAGEPNAASRIPAEDYRRNLMQIVTQLKEDGSRVILMTPNPLGNRFEQWRHTRLAQYAEAAREVALSENVELVDVWKGYESYAKQPGQQVDDLLLDGMHPNDAAHAMVAELLTNQLTGTTTPTEDAVHAGPVTNNAVAAPLDRHWSLPLIDLSDDTKRQVVVDREKGQYLGHVTTVLLDDGKTMFAVYPKGHGRGQIVMKRSDDGGLTWSERLPTPKTWATSREVPTIHRVVDETGKKRLILWSGLYPVRLAVSEDDGATWSELTSAGDWGGIVVMGFVKPLKSKGHYLAMFHDDGRFFKGGDGSFWGSPAGKRSPQMRLFKTFSADGGLTWSFPEEVFSSSSVHLCEPGCIRSPNGKQLAVLLRENRRNKNSHIIFSNDEGKTWTEPRQLPRALTGDRHVCRYAPDGRLVVTFRDRTPVNALSKAEDSNQQSEISRTEGDWVAWVGEYDDLVKGTEGQYRLRLMDNKKGGDTAYPGLELLPDGTFVATTYGHWQADTAPYIVSVRFKLREIDELSKEASE